MNRDENPGTGWAVEAGDDGFAVPVFDQIFHHFYTSLPGFLPPFPFKTLFELKKQSNIAIAAGLVFDYRPKKKERFIAVQ